MAIGGSVLTEGFVIAANDFAPVGTSSFRKKHRSTIISGHELKNDGKQAAWKQEKTVSYNATEEVNIFSLSKNYIYLLLKHKHSTKIGYLFNHCSYEYHFLMH